MTQPVFRAGDVTTKAECAARVAIFGDEYYKYAQHNLGPRAYMVLGFYGMNILLVAVGMSLIYVANRRV